MTTPLVSICSITYNHAPFIRQCLDGFLMQQCNFPIEIIINDDCSTDGTTEIIREYAEKYPDKIFPIFHEENLYSQGVRGMFQKFVFPKARGKYIALCEGDDYWTDPLKLQKQVDFLESHPDYSMCFHKAEIVAQDGREKMEYFAALEQREYSAHEVLTHWTIPTASMLFKTSVHIPTHKDFRTGDVIIHAACVASGRVYCMDGKMSVYRLHGTGWSANESSIEFPLKELVPHFLAVMCCFPSKVTKHIKREASLCCFLWLRNYRIYRGLIPFRYVYKSLYYCNYILMYYIVKYLFSAFLRKMR